MTFLPDAAPVTPDLRSPDRFLWALARGQGRTILAGIAMGTAWMLTIALVPGVLGRTIDAGVVGRDGRALLTGCLLLLGLALVQVATGLLRHRIAVANWVRGATRTAHLVGHHVTDAGVDVAGTTTSGEAIATASDDPPKIGALFDVQARFFGGIVAWLVVTVVVLRIDGPLGLLVAAGVPLLSACLILVVRPLTAREKVHRAAEGELTALGADTVAGLRVLRGIGGEDQFLARYTTRSRQVLRAGSRVAAPQATLDAAEVLLPGLFTLVFVWLGARAAVTGRVTPGELVALYGYAAFLRHPLGVASETLGKVVRARVAAARVVRVLGTGRVPPETATAADPPAGVVVQDVATGLRLEPGAFTALVSPEPDEAAAVADRLARLVPGEPPLIGAVPATALTTAAVRRRILVSEAEPRLFSGTLRAALDPAGRHPDRDLLAAVEVADAGDVLDGLPGGLDGRVEERGRSFSGGQRQRIALARAVLAAPEVLVLVEPTSAVDAHTESRIADRLRAARSGRTTLVVSTSPLLLDRADRVAFLAGGRVTALGTHRHLLRTDPAYRETVVRGEDT